MGVWSTCGYCPAGCFLQLFTHVTRFLGFKVVLLGQFNGQGMPPEQAAAIKHCLATSDGLAAGQAAPAGPLAACARGS